MLTNIKRFKISIISLLIVLLLSFFVLYTPKPVTSNNNTEFSAVRAAKHIEEISREPHSYYDQAELLTVRTYIENKLSEYFNGNVETFHYTAQEVMQETGAKDLPYGINNVLGVLQGENAEGIVIMAHYDSRGHVGRLGELGRSYGAMDDGYGVGTMLELAYLLKDENPKNSVYFLFTDAEEVGLYGAKMAAQDERIMKNAKFVINLESRGRYGPAYMFETSNNNSKVIDLYKNAKLPITYSMATAVYSVMPNFTDFTPFKDANVPGINFAILAGLENYHTPLDRYENINVSSIQHMGVQTEPVIREFMNDSKYIQPNYFNSNSDQVFFTLFAGVMVSYSQTLAIILVILLVLGFGLVLALGIKNKEVNTEVVKKTLLKGLLLTVILLVGTLIFSNVAAFLGKTEFSITYTRMNNADIPSLLMMLFITFILVKLFSKSKFNNILLVGIGVNTLLALVTTFFLPGASFLFTITALLGLLIYAIRNINNNTLKNILSVLSYTILIFILLPLLWSFYNALTIGGLVLLVLLLLINSTVTIPIILNTFKKEQV